MNDSRPRSPNLRKGAGSKIDAKKTVHVLSDLHKNFANQSETMKIDLIVKSPTDPDLRKEETNVLKGLQAGT